jgi:hypothetical protein
MPLHGFTFLSHIGAVHFRCVSDQCLSFAIPLLAGPQPGISIPLLNRSMLYLCCSLRIFATSKLCPRSAPHFHCFAMPSHRSAFPPHRQAFPLLRYAFAPLFNALAFLYSSFAYLCSSEALRFGSFP